jgi:Bacterial Ig domain
MTTNRALQYLAFAAILTCLPGCGPNSSAPKSAPTSGEAVLHGQIDLPAPGSRIQDKVVVGGWAFATGGTVQEVSVSVDGKQTMIAAMHGARPDVAQAFHEPGAGQSGWNTILDTSGLAPGKHDISVWVTMAGGAKKTLGTVSVTK